MDDFKYIVNIPKKNKYVRGRVAWCNKNVGVHSSNWKIGYTKCPDADIPYVYYFKNEEDAVMFKLIFG